MEFKEWFSLETNPEYQHSESEVVNFYIHHPQMKVVDLAKAMGKSTTEVYRILHNNNIQPNRQGVNRQVVLDCAKAGYSIPQIAELTGYTTRNVRYILGKKLTEEM